jgi:hypothetical protein
MILRRVKIVVPVDINIPAKFWRADIEICQKSSFF